MPEAKSCSICCIAMLSNITYKSAIERIFGENTPKRLSMNFIEMENALNKVGLKTNRLNSFPSEPSFNLLCQCRSKSRRFWHYIVYDKQRNIFLDPMPDEWPLDDYIISKCIAIVGKI